MKLWHLYVRCSKEVLAHNPFLVYSNDFSVVKGSFYLVNIVFFLLLMTWTNFYEVDMSSSLVTRN